MLVTVTQKTLSMLEWIMPDGGGDGDGGGSSGNSGSGVVVNY